MTEAIIKAMMDRPVRIGVIGDLDLGRRSHVATNEALRHAADALAVPLETTWLPTCSLEDQAGEARLGCYDALWCAPGSPYKSMEGALRAIRFAREQGRPFIAT